LATDVGRLRGLASDLAAARNASTARLGSLCAVGDSLELEGLAFSRGPTTVNATRFAAKAGDVLAVSGPNGAGKSSLFGLLQACVRGVDAPPGLDLAAGGSIVVPRSVVHVSQRTYGPLHARPVDWLATRAPRAVSENETLAIVDGLFTDLDFYSSTSNVSDLARDHDDFAGGLSGGQKVKLELVRQLFLPAALGAPCPGLLLLDEIFSPLDPASKAAVRARLKRACPDAITLAIYHHDAGACVPPADFFTDVLHFGKQPDDTMAVARVRTC
jgi:ABC-type transport system involved in cytochrome bd biosynthesis fused ATPase/permease subunit